MRSKLAADIAMCQIASISPKANAGKPIESNLRRVIVMNA
jgi:hypothetical protein